MFPGPECPSHYLRHARTVRRGFSEAPPEVLRSQVPFSKLASKDAALFALPKGRRDAPGIELSHRTLLPEPGEGSESGSNFPAQRGEARAGGRGGERRRGRSLRGRGLAAPANGASRRGGEARRQRRDAPARSVRRLSSRTLSASSGGRRVGGNRPATPRAPVSWQLAR